MVTKPGTSVEIPIADEVVVPPPTAGVDFRAVFEASLSACALLATDLTILAASNAYLRTLMASRDALLGRPLLDIFRDDPSGVQASIARVLTTRASDTIALRCWTVTNSPVLGADGTVVYIIHQLEAVTPSEAERSNEGRFQYTTRGTNITLFQQGADLRYKWLVNPIRGYSLNSMLGRTDDEIPHTIDDVAALVRAKRSVLQSGQGTRIEVVDRADGVTSYHEVILEPMRDETGTVLGLLGASVDTTERRRAEAEARRLAAIIDGTPDFVAISGTDGRIVYLNRAGKRMLGIPDDADPGAYEHAALCPAWVYERTQREWLPVALRDGSVADEGALLSLAGEEIPVSFVMLVHRNSSGDPEYLSTIARDVTEQKRVEEALRAATEKAEQNLAQLEAIVNNMTEGLSVASPDGQIVMCNPAWLALHGYGSLEEAHRHAQELADDSVAYDLDGRELPLEERPLARALRGEVFSGQEIRVLRKIGREWIGSYGGAPVRDRDGTLVSAILTARDVTEQKRDEAALRRQQQAFRALAENIPALVARFDRALRHVYVNRQVEAASGIPTSAFIGKTNRDIGVAEELCAQGEARLRHVFETGTSTSFEYAFPSPTGPKIFQSWFGPEFSASGTIETALCITRDVTEQKELENELRRRMAELADADRRKDEFLAILAHELRNPLAPLRNGLELLRLGANDPAVSERARAIMERQLGHLVRLVDDLLDVARITRGKLHLHRERVELGSVVQSAVEASRPGIEAAGHTLTISLPPDPIHLHADATRLAQVISNLLTNAAKYTDPGGHIWLSAERREGTIALTVRDDGVGIAAEHLPGLFQMFSQVTPALERAQGGLGIGLALVKGLTELHGGTVSVRSEGLNRGSEFTVVLPILDVPQTCESSRHGPSVEAPGYRVLIVDDNTDSADTLATLLDIMGCEVRTAYDGEQALRAAEEFQPSVVLLDIGMPRMNGYEVCRQIREQQWGRRICIIATTGWGQERDQRRTREAGFDAHLVKPIDSASLLTLLAEQVPAARARG